jgi:hypothetical protein
MAPAIAFQQGNGGAYEGAMVIEIGVASVTAGAGQRELP